MARNKIYAIVEGHGEADEPRRGERPAVVNLIVKLLQSHGCWQLYPQSQRPWRMLSCGDFTIAGKLENALRAHAIQYHDCAAVLVLFDLDDGCPKEQAVSVADRIRKMQPPLPFSVVVVCAQREYEGWFLASLESIKPGHLYEGDPDGKRDAKGYLTRAFGYREVTDQSAYTQALEVAKALERSRSFRRLHHAFAEIIEAIQENRQVITPSPPATTSPHNKPDGTP